MNLVLLKYYSMHVDVEKNQYFEYNNQQYYLYQVEDFPLFLEIYHLYKHYMNRCDYRGYSIVKNRFHELVSEGYVLLTYVNEPVSIDQYLSSFLIPMNQFISISHIKEQWIEKIDLSKECLKEYSYSYRRNIEMISLIYYFAGIGENCINILNEMLAIDTNVKITLGLSLKEPISKSSRDLLNPTHYTLSSRMRLLVMLVKSDIITTKKLASILKTTYFDMSEMMYLYARILFPGSFYDDVIFHRMNERLCDHYYSCLNLHNRIIKEVYELLSIYLPNPKISWINEDNML